MKVMVTLACAVTAGLAGMELVSAGESLTPWVGDFSLETPLERREALEKRGIEVPSSTLRLNPDGSWSVTSKMGETAGSYATIDSHWVALLLKEANGKPVESEPDAEPLFLEFEFDYQALSLKRCVSENRIVRVEPSTGESPTPWVGAFSFGMPPSTLKLGLDGSFSVSGKRGEGAGSYRTLEGGWVILIAEGAGDTLGGGPEAEPELLQFEPGYQALFSMQCSSRRRFIRAE